MGKNKNKQKELVNDLDIKNIGQVKAESVESTVDNSIEKDNKIKELEREIKKLNGFEEEYKRLKSLEIAAEELKKKGFEIDRKIITMRDIKKVGTFEATIHFFKDVEIKLPVIVVAENQPEPKAEKTEETVETPTEEIDVVEGETVTVE